METDKKILRFVIIPKVAHPWFEEVHRGAMTQAQFLEEQLGRGIQVDYLPPATADVDQQNSVLAQIAASRPAQVLPPSHGRETRRALPTPTRSGHQRSAAEVWLSNELPAAGDVTEVWFERGARARRSEIRSAHRGLDERDQEDHMDVIIGVDPHKGSHTAVAIGGDEARLAKVKVRATRRQVDELLEWAARFEERTWAIESAGGLGYPLA